MAQKKKRLVDDFDLIIKSGDFEAFKSVFEKCEIDAKVPGGITANSDKAALYRLTELTVKWVLANPDPIPLGKVEYIH
jgi:hypothetical protein